MVYTDKFNLLHSYIFRKKNLLVNDTFSYKDKSILYICQNGTSGYANAAKGYIYDYISKKIPVKTQYFNCNDDVNENDRFHQYLNTNTSINIEYNTIIVHSTPDIWTTVIKNAPDINIKDKIIIGRTVWEFEKLLPAWVDSINTSIVDIVSVPTEWNKRCFINSGVTKPIIVEPHIYVDYPHKNVGFSSLAKKSIVLSKEKNLTDFNPNEYYKFYCIGQLIERKGIIETIDAFCNAFTSKDKVVLFVKTFRLNHSKEEQQKCLLEIVKITDRYNHAPIIYIKDSLNYDEIKSLHDIGDCYFHLTKAEGFCLGAFDAFNNDKKIIITGYSGHTEYLGKDYVGLVKHELKSLDSNESVFFQFKLDNNYKWSIPDKKHAIELTQKLYRSIKSKLISVKNNDLSILYIGQYGTSGYATAAKQYVADYVMRNVPIRWEPLYFDESKLDNNNYVNILAKSAINKKIDGYNTVILHCTPDLWPQYLEKHKDTLKDKKVIGYTVWETNILNPVWVANINLVSEVWCPSSYNKQVFENSGVTIPIKVVPHLFFRNTLPKKQDVTIHGAIDGYYTFYNVSEYNERKNINELLETYCQTFTSNDCIQLILKIHYKDYLTVNLAYCKQEIDKILKKYPYHAHIVVLYDNLDDNDLLNLHAYGDCYITLTRSEGFGLTIFDAYNYGKKIIATGYSGYIDFLGNDYEGLVNYKLINVDGMKTFNNNYNHAGQLWAQPDLEHTKLLMKQIYGKNI